MSQTESAVQPLSLRQALSRIFPDDIIPQLFDLLTWFRGDMRIGQGAFANTIAANGSGSFDIEPPDNSEEWEILYTNVRDSASVDVTDRVQWSYRDEVTTNQQTLQDSQLTKDAHYAMNMSTFPNRSVLQKDDSIVTSIGDTGFICKKRDQKSSWLKFRCEFFASATVGVRTLAVTFVYRRRRLI